MSSRITELFGIEYPIIQGGMVWCSGWRLASAVSEAGGLGLLGAGSMSPDLLRSHIQKCKLATKKPFGVNIPLLYPKIDEQIAVILEEKVPIVFTSAGNPSTYTALFKSHGIKVVHVVSSVKFALKAQEAGVDALVGEGFEAGGHNGREETTTLCLIPMIKKQIHIPLIAAGGVGSGEAMAACMALGAEGVQIGSMFAVCIESSAHDAFKQYVFQSTEGATDLVLKKVTPVRLLKNELYTQIKTAENQGADAETLKAILGKGRAKLGIFDGNLSEGELEIGQVSAQIKESRSAKQIVDSLMSDYRKTIERVYHESK